MTPFFNIGSQKLMVCLLIILVLAGFFRLWHLESIPPGLYPDVAMNGNDALETLKTGNFKVFYPENNGREGLWIWLIAVSFSLFGVSVWSIKIVAAAIGILTVLGLYLLTKELFFQWGENRSRLIGFLASFFLATSFWHTNFSRIGFRAIMVPFILVFAFYFLCRGFRQKKISDFIISGIFFGLGFYTYIAYRFVVFLLPIVLVYWWFIYRKQNQTKEFLLFIVLCSLFIIVVALPIGIYFLQHPQDFIGRAAGVSVFSQENPLRTTAISFYKHLIMFFSNGDYNWRHNFAGNAMLPPILGILMYVGIFIGAGKIFEGIKNKNWQGSLPYLFLIAWFFIMLIPGILTYEGIPHALRTIGVIPPVYIFSAIGLIGLIKPLEELFVFDIAKKRVPLFLIFAIIISVGFAGYDRYFNKWAGNPNVGGAFSKDYAEIGNYLNSLPDTVQIYVIVNQPGVAVPYPDGIPMPAQTPMFIESTEFGQPRSIYLSKENLDQIKIIRRHTVIVPLAYDESLFNELRQKFPYAEIREKGGIWIFNIYAKFKKFKTQITT